MLKRLWLIGLVVVWTTGLSAQTTQVSLEFSPDQASLQVGQTLGVTVIWMGRELPPPNWPNEKQLQGNFPRLTARPVVVRRQGDQVIWQREYRLDPYLPGQYTTGTFDLPTGVVAGLPTHSLTVAAIPGLDHGQLQALPEGLRSPGPIAWSVLIVGLATLLALGGVGVLIWVFQRRRPPPPPVVAPWPALAASLETTKAHLHTLDTQEYRQLYRRLSEAWSGPLRTDRPDLSRAYFYQPGLTWPDLEARCQFHHRLVCYGGGDLEFEQVEADLDTVLFALRQGGDRAVE